MGLPSKLKDSNIFNEGESYLGQSKTATLPKLTRLMEGWRGGGMLGEVKVDHGLETPEFEWTVGGLALQALRQFGATEIDAVQLRFVGAYQREDTAGVDAVEVVVRGRHEEIDMGDQEIGEDTETKIKTTLVYYKLSVNGKVEIEIDMVSGDESYGGVPRRLAIRQAIGAA